MEENTIITEGLPTGYRIIAETSDGQFYPQRIRNGGGWDRFATRFPLEGGNWSDTPISLSTEELARDLIAYDRRRPHQSSFGSIVYTWEEFKMFLGMHKEMVQWRTLAADFAYAMDQMVIGVNPNGYTGVIHHKMGAPLTVTLNNQRDFIAKYREMRGIKLDE